MSKYTLIGPFTQVVTMDGLPLQGPLEDGQLPVVHHAGILCCGDTIESVDDYDTLLYKAELLQAVIIPLSENAVALPGFIDAHTHICFAGSRARDYAMRNAGKTYLEIAHAGGGIWDTVQQTRHASVDELTRNTASRAAAHVGRGTTTIEVKSGYGLTVAEEIKMLTAIKNANEIADADLIPTCLAAHILPRDFEGDADAYLQTMVKELFPVLQAGQLTKRIDAFVEQTAFSAVEIAPYFAAAREYGFDITVHADQFTAGGSKVAIDFNAVSADHLEASTEADIKMLAGSGTVAIALPGASMGLGCAFTPARKILNAGGILAIASDHNPGSAPMGNLLLQASVLGAFEKLSNAEVLAAITFRAAHALRLRDRGVLAKGMLADIAVFNTNDHREVLYHQGMMMPGMVIKNGVVVVHQ